MAANIAFVRKMVADELIDTMFFSTGEITEKDKSKKDCYILKNSKLTVEIYNWKRIKVNGDKCASPREAKYVMQQIVFDI